MNVAIFAPYATTNATFGTDLELAQRHLDNEDHVTFITCDSDLTVCDRNPRGFRLKCWECMQMQRRGLASLESSENLQVVSLGGIAKNDVLMKQDIEALDLKDINELKSLVMDRFNIGYAVASSIITRTGNSRPNLDRLRSLATGLILSSKYVYVALDRFFDAYQFDQVYVFNGRYSITASAIAAAKKNHIAYATHDRGRTHEYFETFDDASAADMKWFQNMIETRWLESDVSTRTALVDRWYQRKRNGQPMEWLAFTAGQTAGRLPSGWNGDELNFVVFTTSENESATLGPEWENTLFENQASGVKFLAEQLEIIDRKLGGTRKLYVRIHPNQISADLSEMKRFTNIESENVTVVMPGSKVSTYSMLDACDVVITFGSTMGVEATYWGKPSVLLAPTFYQHVGATYNPMSRDEIVNIIGRRLDPKPRDGAYRYGYFLATLGKPYKHYTPIDQMRGKFNGQPMSAHGFVGVFMISARFIARKIRNVKKLFRQ